MKRKLPANALTKILCAVALACTANVALAADELVLYVFRDNNPGEGLTVVLDGTREKTVDATGSVTFDLDAGAHSVQILRNANTLHSFRFNSAAGQLVDISVALRFGEEPEVGIESYFLNESPSVRARGTQGTLLGRITSYGEPVEGAKITLSNGVTFSDTTDASGSYRIQMPRGIYDLRIEHPDFVTQRGDDLRIVSNIELGANFEVVPLDEAPRDELDIARPQIEELVAVASYQPDSLGESERYSQGVIDTLGIGDLARFGDTQVSASVVRIPSVTVKDNRFIFIRGLGGRYITTTLNGSTLPSTDPSKRTVPLDLFPSNIVSQLDVKKSFTPDMNGESTGGSLIINTRTFPAEDEGQLYARVGATTDLTGSNVLSDPTRGDWDWLGFDDGSRGGAATYRGISAAIDQSDFYPPGVERELGRVGGLLLTEDLDPNTTTATPLVSVGGNYGRAYDLDNGSELGFFMGGNYRNKWNQRYDGIERTYGASTTEVELRDDFDFEEYINRIELNGLLAIGWNVGNSSYASNTLASRVTDSRVKQKVGIDGDEFLPSIRNTIEWVERTFVSQQFTGNHIFGNEEEWTADWQFTASTAQRDAPDRREVRYDLDGADGIFNLEVPTVQRRWDELSDYNFDLSGDLEWAFNDASTLAFGARAIRRERDADSETYGFRGGQSVDDNAPNLQVSDVLNADTITGDTQTGYTFDDKTLVSDSYEADLDLYALYGTYDTLIADTWQIVVGARWEDFEQTTDTFSLEGAQEPVQAKLDESELLPSLVLNWFLTDNQQLRFGVSKTVSRPDFKETSNATFFDPDFDVRIRGNPNLEIATAINYDARYEYYWNDADSISFALFYKDLDKPIERVVLTASGTASNSRTFVNADSGEIYGAELDFRKEFGLTESLSQTFFVGTNASWIESEVGVGDKPPLQGQPEYTFNLILGYDDIDRNQQITLLVNQNGDTVVDRGVSGQDDVVLEPRLDVQINYQWFFSDNWQLGLKAKNLLDDEVEFTQGGNPFQVFKTGVELQAGLTWNF